MYYIYQRCVLKKIELYLSIKKYFWLGDLSIIAILTRTTLLAVNYVDSDNNLFQTLFSVLKLKNIF